MTNYSSPATRCFSTELKELDLEILLNRKKDIELYIKTGMYFKWMIVKDELPGGILNIKYWDDYDIARYRRLLFMELLDRCKKFELYPKLKFYF